MQLSVILYCIVPNKYRILQYQHFARVITLNRIIDWSSETVFRISNNDTNSLAIHHNNSAKLFYCFIQNLCICCRVNMIFKMLTN